MPLPPKAEDLSGLGTAGDLHVYRLVEGGHLKRGAEGRLTETHRHLAHEVGTVPLEEAVLLQVDHEHEISRWATALPGLTLPG